ncbi:MAG TPA: hypothetical protein PLC07_10915, partial [Bacillota bacterium]|nr:hypothetical protein [Bacillota bacterium]
ILNVKENRPDYILIARPEALSRNTFELAKLATDLAKYTQIIDVNSGESIISKISSLINSAIHDYSANLLKN